MSKQTEDFINKYRQDVINATKNSGIFPSVKIAQMIIESSGKDENGKFAIGKGILARKGNNFFGIKASKGWNGQTISLPTPRDAKPVSLFRSYNSVGDSIKDHTEFLRKNSRYTTSGVFSAQTPEAQAQALDRAYYSELTNPKSPKFISGDHYSKGILNLIKAYNLKTLDQERGASRGGNKLVNIFLLLGLGFLAYKVFKP